MTHDAGNNRIRDLLPDRYDHLDDAMRHRVEQAPEFARQRFPSFLWETIGTKVTDAVSGALDLNVFGVFARAWCKGAEIRRYAKESKDKPGAPITLCLGEHKAAATLQPTVNITILPFGTHQVPFELALVAEFDSAELTLLDGAIVSIGAGVCRVTAQMKLGGQPLHDAKKSPKLRLGHSYELKPKLQVA